MGMVNDAVDRIIRTLHSESNEYKELLAKLLGRLDPTKPAGTKLCDAIMRLWPTPAFEAIALRIGDSGTLDIYLRRRAMDDSAYPGEWHAPGSLYRHGEQDRDVANRLEGEFGIKIKSFNLVGHKITSEARGTVHSLIFMVNLADNPRIDDRHNWFSVNDLPKVTVDLHREIIIPTASEAYWRRFLKP